jgi:hypothetical protein
VISSASGKFRHYRLRQRLRNTGFSLAVEMALRNEWGYYPAPPQAKETGYLDI